MNPGDTDTVETWSARNMRPVTAVYVLGVFGGFMALAHFVFHSPEAVRALFLTAVGSVVALVPGILARSEYRCTEAGLAKRPLSEKKPQAFRGLFSWDELSHVVPTRSGFKYFKKMDEPRRLMRFLKLHFSGDHSGEFHVEPEDLERVRALVDQRGRPTP